MTGRLALSGDRVDAVPAELVAGEDREGGAEQVFDLGALDPTDVVGPRLRPLAGRQRGGWTP